MDPGAYFNKSICVLGIYYDVNTDPKSIIKNKGDIMDIINKCGFLMNHCSLEESKDKVETLEYRVDGVTLKMTLLKIDDVLHITSIFVYTDTIHVSPNEDTPIPYTEMTRSRLIDYIYRFRDGLADLANLSLEHFKTCLPDVSGETKMTMMGAAYTTGVDIFQKRVAVAFYLAGEETVARVALLDKEEYNPDTQSEQFKTVVESNTRRISQFLHTLEETKA